MPGRFRIFVGRTFVGRTFVGRTFASRTSRGRRRHALIVAVLLIGAAGCTDRTPPKQLPPQQPIAGGTLRVAVRDLSTLDPAKATGRGALFVLGQIFDSLTAVDANGAAIPAAAESWIVTPDGKTWTFKLRKASFHNGAGVSAFDFKFAFDRLTVKSIASDAAFQLEAVTGFKAARIDGSTNSLTGVTVTDATTLRIALDKPFYELPVYLAHPSLGPVSQKVFNANPTSFGDTPIGNGAFKVSGGRTPSGVELVRFDQHAGASAYLNGVSVTLGNDVADGYRKYLDGSVEIAEVPAAGIESGRGKFGPTGFTPFWAGVYYGPNLRLPKFANPQFRKAISLAIDRAAIAATVYGGTKSPSTGVIPRGIPGFSAPRCDSCLLDIKQAGELVKQVFGTTPPTLIIDHLDASPSREVAAAVRLNLAAIGVTATLRAHQSADYLTLLQSGKQELAELGWLAEVPSPDGFLAQQLRSGSPNNQVAFSDKEFDALIDKARSAPDSPSRRAIYQEAEARALTQMPLIPVVFFRNHIAVSTKVRDIAIDGSGGFDASVVWLEQ